MSKMATGRHETLDFKDRFSCGLCMEPYRGRTPKLLPCFHTFCLPCLENLAATAAACRTPDAVNPETSEEDKQRDNTKQKRNNSEEIKDGEEDRTEEETGDSGVVFQCPACRAAVPVPEGGVSQFQTNFYVEVDDPSDSPPPVMCDTCEEGSRDKATHECADCRNKMCSRCSRLHGMFAQLQGHRVRPLDVAPAVGKSATRVPKPRECPSHPSQPMCFHCRQCDVSICLHCKLTSHEGHATEDFMAAVTRAKGELSRLIVTANQQIQVLEAVLGRLERDLLELSRQKQEMTSSVSSRYEALVSWVTRARDEALEEVECVERAVMKEIEAERILARDTKQLLSHLAARATYSCQTDADVDIVLHKSELQAALLRDDALDRYRKRGSKEGDVKFFTYRSDEKAIHLDQVRDFVGRHERQDQSEKDKMQMMSIRELSETALEIIKSLNDLKGNLKREIEDATKSLAFKVRPSANQNVPAANSLLVFDEVEFNEGDCYDKTTGIFTASVDGTYVFLANIYTNYGTGYSYCSLSVDGKPVDFMNVMNSVGILHNIISLNAGQKVSLLSNQAFTVYSNPQYTFYTGGLLRPRFGQK